MEELQRLACAERVACRPSRLDELRCEAVGDGTAACGRSAAHRADAARSIGEGPLQASTAEEVLAHIELLRILEPVEADWAAQLTLQIVECAIQHLVRSEGRGCHGAATGLDVTDIVWSISDTLEL